MTRALALLLALATPLSAGEPIRVYLDGEFIGTHKLIEYRIAESEIHVTTYEGVYGCEQDRIFADRFE